jgi:hypothetical protein
MQTDDALAALILIPTHACSALEHSTRHAPAPHWTTGLTHASALVHFTSHDVVLGHAITLSLHAPCIEHRTRHGTPAGQLMVEVVHLGPGQSMLHVVPVQLEQAVGHWNGPSLPASTVPESGSRTMSPPSALVSPPPSLAPPPPPFGPVPAPLPGPAAVPARSNPHAAARARPDRVTTAQSSGTRDRRRRPIDG